MSIESIADIVRVNAAESPAAPAIVYGNRTLTYGQLDERSSRLANALPVSYTHLTLPTSDLV